MTPGVSSERELDAESADWLRALVSSGPDRELALARLHAMLLRVARSELRRREGRHPVTGPELDDLAHQAADDALWAIYHHQDCRVSRGEPVHHLGLQIRGARSLGEARASLLAAASDDARGRPVGTAAGPSGYAAR
jgi:hypothetical protein